MTRPGQIITELADYDASAVPPETADDKQRRLKHVRSPRGFTDDNTRIAAVGGEKRLEMK